MYLVLSVLIVTVLVANLFLSLVLSQGRFTHHRVSRTQAYYAAKLGMNYAIEMLSRRDPDWPATGTYTRRICRTSAAGCNKIEPDLPHTINSINITVGSAIAAPAPAGFAHLVGTRPINITVDYLYQD